MSTQTIMCDSNGEFWILNRTPVGKGVFGGGYTTGSVNTIDYITTSVAGNATSFGSLTSTRRGTGARSSVTRGVFGGGKRPLMLTQ